MYKFEFWEVVLIAGFALWVGFGSGKFYGRDKERRSQRLHEEATKENDPERRRKLLLEWNELEEDKTLRKVFRKALLKGEKDDRGK